MFAQFNGLFLIIFTDKFFGIRNLVLLFISGIQTDICPGILFFEHTGHTDAKPNPVVSWLEVPVFPLSKIGDDLISLSILSL